MKIDFGLHFFPDFGPEDKSARDTFQDYLKIANDAGGRLWFQLYMWREKELSYEVVRRAAKAGFEALIWTVDIGLGANREHNKRNGFNTPYKLNAKSVVDMALHPEWMFTVMGRYLTTTGMPTHANYPKQFQTSVTGAARPVG